MYNNVLAQEFNWNINDYYGSANITLNVYNDRIKGAIKVNDDFFLCNNFTIIQGTRQLDITQRSDDTSKILIIYKDKKENDFNCGTIYSGVIVDFILTNFPDWFDLSKEFSIKYNNDTFNVPIATRFITEPISIQVPKKYLNTSLCYKFLNTTLGCADIKTWIDTYSNTPAIIINGVVSDGKINICNDEFVITQNKQQISKFSYWSNNSSALIENVNMCKNITSGVSFKCAIYNFPDWFDINKPFVLSIGTVDFNFNSKSLCAAEASGLSQLDLNIIRKFKNNFLSNSYIGKKIISCYYNNSYLVINAMSANPSIKSIVYNTFSTFIAIISTCGY